MKGEFTFLFLNFLIIDLCNSSANSLFEIFPFLIALPEADLSARAADYLSFYFAFLIYTVNIKLVLVHYLCRKMERKVFTLLDALSDNNTDTNSSQ